MLPPPPLDFTPKNRFLLRFFPLFVDFSEITWCVCASKGCFPRFRCVCGCNLKPTQVFTLPRRGCSWRYGLWYIHITLCNRRRFMAVLSGWLANCLAAFSIGWAIKAIHNSCGHSHNFPNPHNASHPVRMRNIFAGGVEERRVLGEVWVASRWGHPISSVIWLSDPHGDIIFPIWQTALPISGGPISFLLLHFASVCFVSFSELAPHRIISVTPLVLFFHLVALIGFHFLFPLNWTRLFSFSHVHYFLY